LHIDVNKPQIVGPITFIDVYIYIEDRINFDILAFIT